MTGEAFISGFEKNPMPKFLGSRGAMVDVMAASYPITFGTMMYLIIWVLAELG